MSYKSSTAVISMKKMKNRLNVLTYTRTVQNFKVLDIYSVLFLDGIAQIRLFIIKII